MRIFRLGVVAAIGAGVAIALGLALARGSGEEPAGAGPWLVLNGRLVEGPYSVEVVDGELLVNGASLVRPRPDGPPLGSNPVFVARHEVVLSVLRHKDAWIAERGPEAAKRSAVESLTGQAVVARAFADADGVVVEWREDPRERPPLPERIQFREGGFAEDGPEERLASLERRASTYRGWLATPGALVVATDGNVNATWAPRGARVLAEIRRLVRDVSGREALVARLTELLGHPPAAAAIAENFESE